MLVKETKRLPTWQEGEPDQSKRRPTHDPNTLVPNNPRLPVYSDKRKTKMDYRGGGGAISTQMSTTCSETGRDDKIQRGKLTVDIWCKRTGRALASNNNEETVLKGKQRVNHSYLPVPQAWWKARRNDKKYQCR